MHIGRIFITAVCLLTGLVACQNGKEKELLTVPMDVQNVQELTLSTITQESRSVHLEFTDQSLLSDMIGRVLYSEDYIVVFDRKNKLPILFDGNGKFLRTIGSVGQGPGEIASLSDIAADFDRELLYVLTVGRKILCYNFQGEFLKETSFRARYLYFVDGNLLSIAENLRKGEEKINECMLYFMDDGLQVKDSLLLHSIRDPRMIWVHQYTDFVTHSEGNTYQYYFELNPEPFLRDTLYMLKGNKLYPDLRIDYGTTGLNAKGERELYLFNIYRSSRYVFSAYGLAHNNTYWLSCYDLKTGERYAMENGFTDDINGSGIVKIRPLTTNSEQYYYIYYPEDSHEEDNPVLCIGTLKQ